MAERSPPHATSAPNARNRKLFLALGIDVWVERRAVVLETAAPDRQAQADRQARSDHQTAPVRESTVAATRTDTSPRTALPDVGATPTAAIPDLAERAPDPWPSAFTIHCFHLGDVFVAVDEALWNRRRFFSDVARAFNGFAAAERTVVRFDWPQGGLSTGADRAFQAFYRHQADASRHRVLCGPLAAALLGFEAPQDVDLLDGVLFLDGQTTTAVKRRIWRLINENA